MVRCPRSFIASISLFLCQAGCLTYFIFFSMPALAGTIKCTECGMVTDTGPFTSRIVDGEKTLSFCDVGDLLTYLSKKRPATGKPEVRDYKTGEWIDARTAWYVRDERKFRTPMGWGIASFKEKDDASGQGSVMNFEAVEKAVR